MCNLLRKSDGQADMNAINRVTIGRIALTIRPVAPAFLVDRVGFPCLSDVMGQCTCDDYVRVDLGLRVGGLEQHGYLQSLEGRRLTTS